MRRITGRVITVLTTAALIIGLAVAVPATAQTEETQRIAGVDRVATAARIAEATYDSSDTALLARAGDFPDALAASGLAGHRNAPVVLNPRDESVTNRTDRALEDLGVERVTILGGVQAISERTERSLRDQGYETDRIAGADRYATAAEVARTVGRDAVGDIAGERTVIVAFGGRFADALSAGPVAYDRVLPVLLSTRGQLHDAAARAMRDVGAEHAILVGGNAVLSERVEQQIRDMGITTERLAGRDRTDTSARVASFAVDRLGWVPDATVLSRGDAFPDALAAAPHGGERHAPILLSRAPDVLSYDVLQWTVDHAGSIEVVRAVGGTAAVSERILNRLAGAAVPPQRTITYSVEPAGDVDSDLAYFAEHVDWTLTDQRGWSLDNDVRWTRVADPGSADVNVYLATPSAVAAADEDCSPEWSCQPAGTNDVYINEDHWQNATATYDDRSLDAYRHYVVLHEIGHAPPMNLGHYRCEEDGDPDDPAPVMEQQSQQADVGTACTVNVWPLPFELDEARDRMLGASTYGSGNEDQTHSP